MSQAPASPAQPADRPAAVPDPVTRPAAKPDRMPVRHYGYTRFSLFSPDSGAWVLTRGAGKQDVESYAQHLFSEERMKPRCDIFCDLAAPLYDAMAAGKRYRHFVAYSPLLPERWRTRLQDAAERYPVLQLVESETDKVDVSALIRADLEAKSSKRDVMVFAFRVDDDDLLATDFLRKAERYVIPEHHGFALSFARGFAAMYEDGGYISVRRFQKPFVSMGQGAIGRWTAAERELELNHIGHHNRTPYRRPTLVDGRFSMFLQTRHVGQDTALREDLADVEGSRAYVLGELDRLPEVDDLESVFEKFPVLRGRVELTVSPTTEEGAATGDGAAGDEQVADQATPTSPSSGDPADGSLDDRPQAG